ncbi:MULTISPECIES: hypothetical protein [unclassified Streptomyces]|uniref:hypothetical protein n=1 Tax=unclassified Streptomyces TaxID=2593676 RepID=UPI002258B928|nr:MULTISPECIES: hypothetical protein [unclassified Streptomyces]MCX4405924.1 hypothetical protein [Streptomyces sp. NBC_01764]MCX5189552.1 hypothetical protein [Streptomyces sp. NBC_00268]
MRYRDLDCTCAVELPGGYRRLCQNCRTAGPLPGSLADSDWEQKQNDPAVLREAADRLAARVPPATAGPYTNHDRKILAQAAELRAEADRITEGGTR